jgi:CheY-like chemotaxis protein
MTARSVPGEGSTFILHLPVNLPEENLREASSGQETAGNPAIADDLALANEANAPAADAASDSRDLGLSDPVIRATGPHSVLQGTKVLVIDDDQRNAFAITGILEYYGLTVSHALSGQTGIEMLKSASDTDLVLMDVMMPGLDGYATTAAIRLIPEIGTVPIIAVTARAMQGDREKSIDAGANDYVTKPVDTEELLACIERTLGLAGAVSAS